MRRLGPTITVLAVFGIVFAAEVLIRAAAPTLWVRWFVLAAPLTDAPWALVTSVYAHDSVGHLLGNAIALLVLGLGVERVTTPARYHAFFLGTGAIAGITQVLIAGALGTSVGVLGASGAVFGLLGYALAGNALSRRLFDRLSLGATVGSVLIVLVAAGLTIATARSGTALIAHFAGLVIGLVAGRFRLLHR